LGFATVPTVPAAPQPDLLEAILRELREQGEVQADRVQVLIDDNERLTVAAARPDPAFTR